MNRFNLSNFMTFMTRMLCLLLCCLTFPALAEESPSAAPEISAFLAEGGALWALGDQGDLLRREMSADEWDIALSGDLLRAALPTRSGQSLLDDGRFDFAHAVLLEGGDSGDFLAVIPTRSGQIAVLRLNAATAEVSLLGNFSCQHAETEAVSFFLPTRTLLDAALMGDTLFISLREETMACFVYALSLTDGDTTLLSEDPVCALLTLPDDESQLLVCLDRRTSAAASVLAMMDAASGDLTRLCTLPDNAAYSGFTLSGDALYFTDGQTLFESRSPFTDVAEIGYLPAVTGFTVLPGAVVDGRYWTYTAQDGFLSAALSGEEKTVLRIENVLSLSDQQQVTRYLRQHPELTVVYEDCNAQTAPEIRQHMESDEALDIYAFTLPDAAFFTLRDRGFLLDLTQDEALSTFADGLAPNLTQSLRTADGLYALPIGLPSATCWQINTDVLREAGFDESDIPDTWASLLSLIRRYLDDSSIDSQSLPLVQNPDGLADALFTQLFQAQLLRCEQDGRAPCFTDDDFVSALTDYIALRPALLDYETRWLRQQSSELDIDGGGGVVTIWSSYTSTPSLLGFNVPLAISGATPPMQTLTLSFSGEEITLSATMTVLAVSRRSPHAQEATSLLLALSQGQRYEQQLTWLPDFQETVLSDTYLTAQEELHESEALLEEYRSALSDDALAEAELNLAEMRTELATLSPYRYSPEEIEAWHDTVSRLHLVETTLFSGEDNSVETLIRRFLDGELETAQFVQQLTRIVDMMRLENT